MRYKLFFTLLLLWPISVFAFSAQDLTKFKNGIVSIKVRINKAAINTMGPSSGTGFVVDKQNGLIVTNRHVVGSASSGNYELTFNNGREIEGDLLYVDPWHDFAILKADLKPFMDEVEDLLLTADIKLDEEVFIIGKNAGQDFSIQTGWISSLYEDMGFLPNQSLRISLNNRGGSSGSPVLNMAGKVVGIIHSSDMDSFGFAMPITFLQDALVYLKEKQLPPRRHFGALLTFYSLDHAIKFFNFPEDKIKGYLKKYPDSTNKCLIVSEVFPDSPAAGVLKTGDIIWSVNGQEIGPNFYQMEKIINALPDKEVKLTIYRNGERSEQKVGLYDLHAKQIKRMVSFGGAIFYEADDHVRQLLGVESGTVMATNILPGSSFYQVFPYLSGTDKLFVKLSRIDDKEVRSLDDLIKLISNLAKKKYFSLMYQNYAFFTGYNNCPMFARREKFVEITYEPLNGPPEIIQYMPEKLKWEIKPIKLE